MTRTNSHPPVEKAASIIAGFFPKVIAPEDLPKLYNIPTSTAYALAAKGEFPKPIQLTAKRSGWLTLDLDRWLQGRVEAGR